MNKECGDSSLLGILDTDGYRKKAECRIAAEQLYLAVQEYGEDAFQESSSTVCEYEGSAR